MLFRKWCLLLVVALAPAAVLADEKPAELNWSTWQHLPVFHNGRMMPLNTFAYMAVETVTGRANPRLAPPESAGSAAAELFPGGEPRKFTAAELVFSWLVEPERWQDVPFLIAGHEDLRSEVLGLPAKDEKGNHLNYASPRQVERRLGVAAKIGNPWLTPPDPPPRPPTSCSIPRGWKKPTAIPPCVRSCSPAAKWWRPAGCRNSSASTPLSGMAKRRLCVTPLPKHGTFSFPKNRDGLRATSILRIRIRERQPNWRSSNVNISVSSDGMHRHRMLRVHFRGRRTR